MDDKIMYALNTSIPTESFASKVDAHSACEDLYSQIQKGHTDRENVIKNCILSTAETVKHLKAVKDNKPDDCEVIKNLKAEQKKVHCWSFVTIYIIAENVNNSMYFNIEMF